MDSRRLKTVATIEARMTSTRLPGKVLAPAEGLPMLALMVERLRHVAALDAIAIATTVNAADDAVAALARELGVGCWRGSEEDVMARVLDAATDAQADTIVELTGDCPLIDPRIVADTIAAYCAADVDYAASILTRSYPIGMDTQVFARSVLADAAARTSDSADREHVSLYIYRHPERYRLLDLPAPPELARPELRLTLDTPEDLDVIRAVFAALRPQRTDFSLAEMLAFLDAHPEVAARNAAIVHRHV